MPAAVAKGIILSISIITALGLAVYENPQVQAWLEEQRKNLVELLRSLGEELDPHTRRQAEAFAYEGRTPATDDRLRREVAASREAAAIATGRSLSPKVSRRIPVRGPSDPDAAEERKRQGREYLAKRNQQMFELQQRRKSGHAEGEQTPTSPTSFDALVDSKGNLKAPTPPLVSPEETSFEPGADQIREQMCQVGRLLTEPLLATSDVASSSRAWQMGSNLANPFGDEFEMDRSETPRPPVPPKVQLETSSDTEESMPLRPVSPRPALSSERSQTPVNTEGLSYEEQMAIALSLSDQDSINSATVRQRRSTHEDAQLKAAIAASLKDLDCQQAAHAVAHSVPSARGDNLQEQHSAPLLDLAPDPQISLPPISAPPDFSPGRAHWDSLLSQNQPLAPSEQLRAALGDPSINDSGSASENNDELYRVTPQLTTARLATHVQEYQDMVNRLWNACESSSSTVPNMPYDPVHECARQLEHLQRFREAEQARAQSSQAANPLDTSSHFAASLASAHSSAVATYPFATEPHHSNKGDEAQNPSVAPSQSTAYNDAMEASQISSDSFASVSSAWSHNPASEAHSQIQDIEVIDVENDSDDGVLSDDGDVLTPDSWTEVGSRDGDEVESNLSGEQRQQMM